MLSVALFNKISNVTCINYMYCINQKSIITLFIRERRKINDHIKFQPYNLIKIRHSESATASASQTF